MKRKVGISEVVSASLRETKASTHDAKLRIHSEEYLHFKINHDSTLSPPKRDVTENKATALLT